VLFYCEVSVLPISRRNAVLLLCFTPISNRPTRLLEVTQEAVFLPFWN